MTLGENSEKKAGIAFLSFELRREKQPDNCLYSYLPDLQYAYLSNYSVIGCSPDYGKGRMMIRYKFAELFHLQSNQIIHATYSTYSLTQNNPQLEMVTVLDEWCSLTGNWHNYYQTGKTAVRLENTCHRLDFDITEEAKRWCDQTAIETEYNGLQLKAAKEINNTYDVLLSNDNSLYRNVTVVTLR